MTPTSCGVRLLLRRISSTNRHDTPHDPKYRIEVSNLRLSKAPSTPGSQRSVALIATGHMPTHLALHRASYTCVFASQLLALFESSMTVMHCCASLRRMQQCGLGLSHLSLHSQVLNASAQFCPFIVSGATRLQPCKTHCLSGSLSNSASEETSPSQVLTGFMYKAALPRV